MQLRALTLWSVNSCRNLLLNCKHPSIGIKPNRMASTKQALEKAKRIAAHRAVDEWIKDETCVGIGSGSTVVYVVERLAERVKLENLRVECVPTSFQARQLIKDNNLQMTDLETNPELNVTIDGADEVDSQMVLIKGGGGCMLQEKIVAACSENLIIVADYTKNSICLGDQYKKGVPLEVMPMAYVPLMRRIACQLGGTVKLRTSDAKVGPAITDNGNFILDWHFDKERQYDWALTNRDLQLMPGVVETGLFVNMANMAYFGMPDGSVKTQRGSV